MMKSFAIVFPMYLDIRLSNATILDQVSVDSMQCKVCSLSSSCGSTEVQCLGTHILVVVNRVDENLAKLDGHYDFPLQLFGKNLIVIGEHIGSSSRSGHWRRHELVGPNG